MEGGSNTLRRQPFAEHLHELRRRLVYCLITLIVGSVAGYTLRGWLLHILTAPLKQQLYYTSPLGGLNAVMKISVLFGVVLMLPVAMYQLAKFLAPAFRGADRRSRRLRTVFVSLLLAAAGIALGYFTSLPVALHFFSHVSGPGIKPLIVVNDYLNFVLAYLVFYAVLFQLPLIMSSINRIKPQKPTKLLGMRYQRWVILLSFILAAFLAPTPDPVSQTLLAVPIVALWQVGVMAVWWQNRRHPKSSRAAETAPAPVDDAPATLPPPIPRSVPQPRYFDIIPPRISRSSGLSSPSGQTVP